jgi:hypothetical protein
MNELFLVYDVKYRDRHGNIRIFSCLDKNPCLARSQAMTMVTDLAEFEGTILTVLPAKDDSEWSNGIII